MTNSTQPPGPSPPGWKLLLARVLRGLLGLLFLVAAALKAIHPTAFAAQIESYGWLPGSLTYPSALFFITLEFLLGAALLLNVLPRLATAGTGALLVGFTVVLMEAWYNGKVVDCGCFGVDAGLGPGGGVLRDLAFLALLVPTFLWGARASRAGWRVGAVVATVLLGLGLTLAAPSLPQGWLTDLVPGADLVALEMEVLVPDQGAVLVVLLDLEAEPSRQAIEPLNDLTMDLLEVEVLSFAAAGPDERFVFGIEHGALFPVDEIGEGTLGNLARRLPRFALLVDGKVATVWNDQPPDPESVRSALEGGML
ncbi:MAG: hypothetical protein E2P04_01750 [Acidobacteria bacterium]|nr:MAG: hypothetical protein E2P04_01750 [Acidobacteriota bacterium]